MIMNMNFTILMHVFIVVITSIIIIFRNSNAESKYDYTFNVNCIICNFKIYVELSRFIYLINYNPIIKYYVRFMSMWNIQ